MVWRKLIRNPNTYSSLIGLTWSLVSFKYASTSFTFHFMCTIIKSIVVLFWLIMVVCFVVVPCRWNIEMPAKLLSLFPYCQMLALAWPCSVLVSSLFSLLSSCKKLLLRIFFKKKNTHDIFNLCFWQSKRYREREEIFLWFHVYFDYYCYYYY